MAIENLNSDVHIETTQWIGKPVVLAVVCEANLYIYLQFSYNHYEMRSFFLVNFFFFSFKFLEFPLCQQDNQLVVHVLSRCFPSSE